MQEIIRKLKSTFVHQMYLLRKTRIVYRLSITFLIIAIIPLGIVATYSFISSYYDVKESVAFYTSQITRQTARNVDYLIQNIDEMSNRILNSEEVQNDFKSAYLEDELERYKVDDELIKLLSDQIGKYASIDGISLMNASGRYEVHVGSKLTTKNYIESELYKKTIFYNGKALWLAPHYINPKNIETVKKEKVITFSKMIKGKWDGNTLGVLVISIKPEYLRDIFEGMELWNDGNISIINSEGAYIYSEDKKMLGEKINVSSLISRINGQEKNENQYFDDIVDSEKVLVSYTKLTTNDWIVVSSLPYSNLMKKTTTTLKFTIGIIIAFVILSIYVSFSVSHSISNPIKKLMKVVKEVEKGNFDITVDMSGNDEIKHLNENYKSMVDKVNELINELYMAKIIQQQTQIQALKAQINPHFLYNTLETISSIAKVKNVKEISSVAQGLSLMFRYSIKTGSDMVCLKDEIANIKNYLSILKIRYEDKLDYEFSIPNDLLNCKIYKLILQPIVENAVHHGIELKKGKGLIKIEAFVHENKLNIKISDNGIGIEPQVLEKLQSKLLLKDYSINENNSGGIGISNVDARLALYYKDNYQFRISSIYGVNTVVEIIIPEERFEENNYV